MASAILLKLLSALYFMLPAYVANMAPVIVKRVKLFDVRLDYGKTWKDGKPVFGEHKTWRGLVFGVLFASVIFAAQQRLYAYDIWRSISLVDYPNLPAMLGVFFGFGAIMGDAVKSFFKRRRDIAPGKPWIPFDQLDFIVGALLLASVYVVLPLWAYIVLLLISPLLHILTNHIAFYLHIRNEKW